MDVEGSETREVGVGGSETHSYEEIDEYLGNTDHLKVCTMTYHGDSIYQNAAAISNKARQEECSSPMPSPRYGILLGTIGKGYDGKADTVVESSATVHMHSKRPKPPPHIFRGWEQRK